MAKPETGNPLRHRCCPFVMRPSTTCCQDNTHTYTHALTHAQTQTHMHTHAHEWLGKPHSHILVSITVTECTRTHNIAMVAFQLYRHSKGFLMTRGLYPTSIDISVVLLVCRSIRLSLSLFFSLHGRLMSFLSCSHTSYDDDNMNVLAR